VINASRFAIAEWTTGAFQGLNFRQVPRVTSVDEWLGIIQAGLTADAIGGHLVTVDSIIRKSNIGLHRFESDLTVARYLAQVRVVVV
jgi:hypothetical protein